MFLRHNEIIDQAAAQTVLVEAHRRYAVRNLLALRAVIQRRAPCPHCTVTEFKARCQFWSRRARLLRVDHHAARTYLRVVIVRMAALESVIRSQHFPGTA